MASTLPTHNGGGYEKSAAFHDVEHGGAGRQISNGDSFEGAPFTRAVTPGGHALDTSQPAFPVHHRRFANPAPLGLCGFALTTFMLSLINLGTRGVTVPLIVAAPALWYGGLCQILAGMWEFASGNTFAATAFTSYGAFWISYAFIILPWTDIGSSYANEKEFTNGVAFFLWGWFIFTFIMFVASLRSSIALAAVFGSVDLTFLMLALAELGNVGNSAHLQTAGGAFGMFAAFSAWYVAMANLLTPDTSYFTLPVGDISKKD